MSFLTVAYYTALRNLKDMRMLLLLLITPIVLILILGTALDGFFEPRELEQVRVAYLCADDGEAGRGLTAYLQSEQLETFLALTFVDSFEAGEALIMAGEVEAFVYVPSDFSQVIARGGQSTLRIVSPLDSPLVLSFVQSYVYALSSSQAVDSLGGQFAPTHSSYLTSNNVNPTGKVPRAIDYFAVHTLLQVMSMGGWYGIGSVQDDREKNTLVRMRTAPVRQSAVLAGKIAANILVLFIQTLVVILFTRFVYGVRWDGSLLVLAASFFLFTTVIVGIGMLIGTTLKEGGRAFAALWAVMFFFSVVAGAFGKVQAGSMLEKLGRLSPNYYASRAIFGTIFGGSSDLIASSLLVLLSATLGIFGLTVLIGRRKAI